MEKYIGKYIGQPTPVIDALEKVTGETIYADDLELPDLLWGKVLTSPIPHAKIIHIDISEAEALPGVHAVITYQDAPKTTYNRIMRWAQDGLPATERVLDDIVRFVGDKVAAVAAETEAIAQKALRLIKVEYDALPAVFDPEAALRIGAPKLYEEGNLLKEELVEVGDLEYALSNADEVIENVTQTSMVHHGAIEPHICIGRWSRGDKLEIWEPQQGVHRIQIMLGKIFSIPYSKIHVHSCAIGGTFGGKDGILLEPITLLLSQKAGGRPVKIRYNRTESIISTYTRHAVRLYGKMAVKEDGTVQGFGIESYMNAGPYCGGSINIQSAMCGKMFKLYKAPAMRFHGRAVYTNALIGGAMRGFGSPKVFTALELLINKSARHLRMDPVEFRKKNLIQPYDLDPAVKISLGSARIYECLEKGAEAFGWEEKLAEAKRQEDENYAYGCGVATALHGNGVAPFAPDITVAEIMLHEDGSVLLRTGMTDHGAGTYTLLKQIVSETLDMPMEQVEITHSDTHSCPYDMGSGASRNTWSGGAAVETVSRKLLNTLYEIASEMLECNKEDVVLDNGIFYGRQGTKTLARSDISCYAYKTQKRKILEVVSYNSDHNAGSYGAHFAKVRVNKKSGEVKVLEYLAMCDVGTPLNPMLLEGQIEGAIMMGLGMALFEEIRLDEMGAPVNVNLKKYRLPRVSDMPKITISFVDNYEQGGPYGGKSIGEASIVPVVPVIVGAVNDALGTDLGDIPLVPEKIRAALNDDLIMQKA